MFFLAKQEKRRVEKMKENQIMDKEDRKVFGVIFITAFIIKPIIFGILTIICPPC